MEAANSPIFSEICWKTAKNTPFHIKSPVKKFHGRAKGGPSHHAFLNTPLVCIIIYHQQQQHQKQ